MSKAHQAAEWILRQPSPAQTFRALYTYALQYEKMQRDGTAEQFLLPSKLGPALPLFEAFVGEPDSWAKVAKWMWGQTGDAAMYDAFRTANVRAVQIARRKRSMAAMEWLNREAPHLTTEQRAFWRRAVENTWTKRRINVLKAARKRMGGSLSIEEQEQLLDAFWKTVDEDISAGNLPSYEDLTRRTPSL